MKINCITFDKQAKDSLPEDIKRHMEKKIHKWINECNPDWVSRVILASFLRKYDKGSDAIFKKMKQLEDGGHFKLCEIFWQCFVNVGINEEYLKWRES